VLGAPGGPRFAAVQPGSDAMVRAIVQSSVNPYVVLDAAGTVTWASDRVEALLGAPPEAYVGRHFLEMVEPRSHEAAIAEYAEFTGRRQADGWIGPPLLLELCHADGSSITCEVSAASGQPVGIDGVIVQVRRWRGTVLLFAAVDALAGGAPLDVVLRDIAAVAEHDMPGTAVLVAASWDGERYAVEVAAPETARAHPELQALLPQLAGPPDLPADHDRLEALAVQAGFASCWSVPVGERPDERPTARLVVLRPHPGPPGPNHTVLHRVQRLVALAVESDRTRREWRRGAVTDHLTGLPNRAGLEEWLAERAAWRRPERIAVLFCDVDRFKHVNDELGHTTGDRVLVVVAERLRAAVRDDDLVCRWGGDEFLVICTDPGAAEVLAARLIAHVEQPIAVGARTTVVGLSIGVGFGTCAMPLDDLLRPSDHALLEAKERGRHRYVVRG